MVCNYLFLTHSDKPKIIIMVDMKVAPRLSLLVRNMQLEQKLQKEDIGAHQRFPRGCRGENRCDCLKDMEPTLRMGESFGNTQRW